MVAATLEYAGPFLGKMLLVTVDAHSKWLDIHCVTSATSAAIISHLRYLFSTHGLAESIVTDNVLIFVSAEFKKFMNRNGINHCTSTSYSQTCGPNLQTSYVKAGGWYAGGKVGPFPTGSSSAKLLMGRELHTYLNLLHPDLSFEVRSAQERQKKCI